MQKKLRPTPRPPLHRSRSTDDQDFEELNLQIDRSKSETDLDLGETDDEENSEDDSDSSKDKEEYKTAKSSQAPETPPTEEKSVKETPYDFVQKHKASIFCFFIIIIVAIAVGVQLETSPEPASLDLIKESFPTQEDSFWTYFESGVMDVITQNRPSTFILLYKEDAEEILKKLLPQLAQFAACFITNCEKKAIELTPKELNSPRVLRDYGILIEKYRLKLKENGVMIIKNLEKVPGISAQAFHTFCDEFTPLVDRSLFIFTMKVDNLPSSRNVMKFVEDFLRSKWTDIKPEIFDALIARITSMVMLVQA